MLSGRALARTAAKCNLTAHDARTRALFIANTAPRTFIRRHPARIFSIAVSRRRKPGYLNCLIESPFQPTLHHIKLYRIKRSTLIFRSAKLLFSRFVREVDFREATNSIYRSQGFPEVCKNFALFEDRRRRKQNGILLSLPRM